VTDLELLHQPPAEAQVRPAPLLFIHGAWHGAWCWQEAFLPHFAAHGYDCYALSLRGHGGSPGRERLRWTGIRRHTRDVAAIIAELPAAPILIAHSMGAFVTQKVLETHTLPGAVLLAPIPHTGSLRFALRVLRKDPAAFLSALLTLRLYPIVGTAERASHWFLHDDLPEARRAALHTRLQDEAFRIFLDTLLLELPRPSRVRARKTPILVIAAGDDRIFSVAELAATARVYGADFTFLPNAAHNLMIEPDWPRTAELILDWLRCRDL
jgi:pimeloyl-ACP methyl ester carboxylesterase